MHSHALDEFRIHRIVSLLVRTDMSLKEIAERMGCSHDVVDAINREYEARDGVGDRYQKELKLSMAHEKGKPETRLDL